MVCLPSLVITFSLLLSSCACLNLINAVTNSQGSQSGPAGASPSAAPSTLGAMTIEPVKDTGSLQYQVPQGTPPVPPPGTRKSLTGVVSTGSPVEIGTISVPTAGGDLVIDKTGHPLYGLKLSVPANAYSNPLDFKLSYAPVSGFTFANASPLSPVVRIENGGKSAAKLMTLTIPFTPKPGLTPLGCIFNEKTGTLDALPTLSVAGNTITLATWHFSSTLVVGINITLLTGTIDSGFRPRLDDWEFPNWGSYIAPGGHCTGQSMTAMWYYLTKPDGVSATLWGRYDNNAKAPATPFVWQDDTSAYRFASLVWSEMDWAGKLREMGQQAATNKNDEVTWFLFASSMKITGEPQMVEVWDTVNGGGHALVVYQVTPDALWVADPNYPGDNTRKIEYKNNRFSPYSSAETALEIMQGKGKQYNLVCYVPKLSLSDWEQITAYWEDVKDNTIAANEFPDYEILYQNDKAAWVPLKDNAVVNKQFLPVAAWFPDLNKAYWPAVWMNGSWITLTKDEPAIPLKPGLNRVGFFVQAVSPPPKNIYSYVDFVWLNINAQRLAIEPSRVNGKPGEEYTFTAAAPGVPPGARYEWSVDGKKIEATSASVKLKFPKEANYVVGLRMLDSSGTELGTATADAIIQAAATTLTITPSNLNGETNKEYIFTVSPPPPAGITYQWIFNGYNQTKGTEFRFKWAAEGTFLIRVNAIDSNGKVVGQADANVTLKNVPVAVNNLAVLQATNRLRGDYSIQVYRDDNDYKAKTHTTGVSTQGGHLPWNNDPATYIPITWSGTSFSGKWDGTVGNSKRLHEVSGSVSADGLTLVSLKYTYKRDEGSKDLYQWLDNYSLELSNMPLKYMLSNALVDASGFEIQRYITGMSYEYIVWDHNVQWAYTKWTSPTAVDKSSLKLQFYKM
jgi:hypothetical protein